LDKVRSCLGLQNKIKISGINIVTDIFLANKDWNSILKKILPLWAVIFYCIPFAVRGYEYIAYQ
jgi:hypothetical protein